jgi:hypothetical protein
MIETVPIEEIGLALRKLEVMGRVIVSLHVVDDGRLFCCGVLL